MLKRQETAGKPSAISPVLFMTIEGESMRFFLPPGPTKLQLQPHIKAGGGQVTKAQEPGAILLADQEELESLPRNISHWYVSTQYIWDCVEKNMQLEVEDYRLKPEVQRTDRQSSGWASGGRLAYTPEEDAAILSYIVKEDKLRVGGDRLWQDMEKKNVTGHSWQSMKARYKKHLAHGTMTGLEEKMTNEAETKQHEIDVPKSSEKREKQTASPMPAQPVWSLLHRRLEPGKPPSPQTSKRSLPPIPQKTTVSPLLSKEPQSTDKSTSQKDASTDQHAVQSDTSTDQPVPSPKRARGESGEIVKDHVRASTSGFQPGFLEMAKEFESSDNETVDVTVTEEAPQDKHTELSTPNTATTNAAAVPNPNHGCGPTLQRKSHLNPGSACPGPVLSESQDSQSQSVVRVSNVGTSTCPQQRKNEDTVVSLSQTHLEVEEDMHRMRGLMKQSNQDLQSVIRALVKASGNFSVARSLLLTPSVVQGPFWSPSDDDFLRSADPVDRKRLQDKFGEEAVSKRLLFFEAE